MFIPDPGSGCWLSPIPDPGVEKAPNPGSGSATLLLTLIPDTTDLWTIKTPNPICRLFFKLTCITDFPAFCLTDFIDWRYIHSVVGIFDPACELLPLYLLSDLLPPPLLKQNVRYIDRVWLGWGRGCWIVLKIIFCRSFTLLSSLVHANVFRIRRNPHHLREADPHRSE